LPCSHALLLGHFLSAQSYDTMLVWSTSNVFCAVR
jgi:hypothetical protein